MGKDKNKKTSMEVVVIPVDTVLNMIELATARGMQRGSEITLLELRDQGLLTEPKQVDDGASIYIAREDADEVRIEDLMDDGNG